MSDLLRLERLTIQRGRTLACVGVSLSVQRGAVYALLGRKGAGKKPLIQCVLGDEKPLEGRALLFGEDVWKNRRALRRRIALHPDEVSSDRELLLLGPHGEAGSVPPGATGFVLTADPIGLEENATHVGILRHGRLVYDAAISDFDRHLRRIRYVNRMTESRTAFGTELDDFHALRVQVRGWGIDAIVADYDPEAFDRFRALDGVEDASVATMTIAELFDALG